MTSSEKLTLTLRLLPEPAEGEQLHLTEKRLRDERVASDEECSRQFSA
jgi:hypothetical protein